MLDAQTEVHMSQRTSTVSCGLVLFTAATLYYLTIHQHCHLALNNDRTCTMTATKDSGLPRQLATLLDRCFMTSRFLPPRSTLVKTIKPGSPGRCARLPVHGCAGVLPAAPAMLLPEAWQACTLLRFCMHGTAHLGST